MPIKKHGLGRGINSLIDEYSTYEAKKLEETGSKVVDLDISLIKPNPNQPRKNFDPNALMELKDSILSQGIIQPLLVEEIADNVFVIVAGERRYRAAKLAGLKTVPCLVRSFSDLQRMEVSLIENIQRENLNPVEEARAFSYLLVQSGIKQEELAQKVGKSRPAISNSLSILNLPERMLDALEKGLFTSGHARALLSVENPADQEILFNR
ncbi:MAG: ParB/RepB/Spo0J family partition protein, partial [Spirochaetales bacterium]|nr:ParB/RepB/Spo0J family partition protein [Spirochaetales bacterium]